MAAADFTGPVAGADRPNPGLTAGEKIDEVTLDPANDVDAVAADAATAAGVRYAAFVGYDAALDALAARPDIEGLASRRAREAGTDFASADYMRLDAGVPGPGSTNGEAPSAT